MNEEEEFFDFLDDMHELDKMEKNEGPSGGCLTAIVLPLILGAVLIKLAV